MTVRILDLVGEVCPVPLLRIEEAVAGLPPEWELVAETDYPRALRNIAQWCTRRGYSYEIQDRRRGVWRVVMRGSSRSTMPSPPVQR